MSSVRAIWEVRRRSGPVSMTVELRLAVHGCTEEQARAIVTDAGVVAASIGEVSSSKELWSS